MKNCLKALVVGYGSIGLRHINNLLTFPNIQVLVYSKRKNLKNLKKKCQVFDSLEKSLNQQPDIAIVTNETSFHIDTCLKLANSGVDLFIEKPLSNSIKDIKKLKNLVRKKKLITLMGYNFRFNNSIKKIKEIIDRNKLGKIISVQSESGSYLPYWHPYEDYKMSYASRKELGGGVVLTCSHEIDYLYWFFGQVKKVFAMGGRLSELKISAEDHSSILIEFKNRVIAEVHLDYYQKPSSQYCKIIGTKGTIYWNYSDNIVKFYNSKKKKWEEKLIPKKFKRNDMYMQEMIHFLDCVKNSDSI